MDRMPRAARGLPKTLIPHDVVVYFGKYKNSKGRQHDSGGSGSACDGRNCPNTNQPKLSEARFRPIR